MRTLSPSKPATVTGSDINHNSVTLKISTRFGAEDISSYSVEYCVSGEDGWKQETASKAEEVTVSGLSPNTEYMFRCRAETPVGGPANEVSGSIKTLPCSPPGKLHVESTSREIYVSWEKPAELGQDVHVLSYIVEYAKPDQQVKEEDLHWEQMMAGAEKRSFQDFSQRQNTLSGSGVIVVQLEEAKKASLLMSAQLNVTLSQNPSKVKAKDQF
ncbi:Receptor-type tyrosine-protein phosphatase F [Dissostichus eleginoides]|uniref:Receptor-type tyrosine-protein phosphatase F n=1 Tax=Dissostichus eleginoides TaxID=100907 RepID=A0AAD9ERY3_DISEL|nr:Receptor-type tyrosine-protein phosphatase F [Dissostichus eleginoides]